MRGAFRCPRGVTLAVLASALLLAGCEPFFSRQTLSKVFNGVPELPDQEEVCRSHQEQARATLPGEAKQATGPQQKESGSRHRPYAEKRCNSCHASDGEVSNALLKPKNELCFLCHKGVLRGTHKHGPASEGDCLSCHEPHESANPFLLSRPRATLCEQCHEEERLASAMHRRLARHDISCPDCHDPHSGANRYFLK
jgi:predicted CXXCH cytochrome family protein